MGLVFASTSALTIRTLTSTLYQREREKEMRQRSSDLSNHSAVVMHRG
jgi:hypothetical protein